MSKIRAGDRVEVKSGDKTYIGILMPSELDDKNAVVIKLDNGYNVGLKADSVKKLSAGKGLGNFPKLKKKAKGSLPKITLITTGGTITSKVDYTTGAAYGITKPEELLFNIPELNSIANIKIVNPFSISSENMNAKEWQKIATITAKELNSSSEGVIITQGTDILHLTSAALSFMIENLNKPVAIVGGQRSSDRGSFDGAQNLICAAHYCLSDIAEVALIMHSTINDDSCLAMRGTKVRKMHTSRRDAFRPINDLPFAKIDPQGEIEILNSNYRKRSSSKVKLNNKFEEKIALVKFTPGLSPDIIEYYIKKGYKGIIIEGTGLGHIPTETPNKKDSWIPVIKKAVKKKIFVGITSQCIYGRTDPLVYKPGRLIKDAGAIYLEDMLPETAYIKLGWTLGQTKIPDKVKSIMLTNKAGEINPRIPERAFLY